MKTNHACHRSTLVLAGIALLSTVTMADPIEAVKGRYDNNDWFNVAASWADNALPDSTKDYIISGNYKSQKADGSYADYVFRFAKNYQVFNGRSIQFGDPAVPNSPYINMCMSEGNVTFNNEGLKLGAGTLCSWWENGSASAQRVHNINGKIEVVAPATAPYTMGSSGKNYFTFNFTGAFSGDSDRGLKLSADGTSFIWNFSNAAQYYGDLAFVGKQTATATGKMNQIALRTLTAATGSTFELTGGSTANTLGTYAGAESAKVVFGQFPGTALTITNALTGGIVIDLRQGSATIPGRTDEAWTNDYPILTLSKDVSFAPTDIVINDRLGTAVQEGIERLVWSKVNTDGSTTYFYRLCQPYPMFFAAAGHSSDPSAETFWSPAAGRDFVSPLDEGASRYAYCEATKSYRTSFGSVTFHAAQYLISNSGFAVLGGNPVFLNDGLLLGDGTQLYNWNAKYHYTLSGKVTVLGKLTVLDNSKGTNSIQFAEETLYGGESAIITHTTSVSASDIGLVIKSAENYRGSLDLDDFTTRPGCGVYLTLGDTGTSALKAVSLTSNFLFKAVAATDRTAIGDLTLAKDCSVVLQGDGETLNCLTVTNALSFVSPLKIDCSKVTYPALADKQKVLCPVLKWPKGSASYALSDFTIDNTGAKGLRKAHQWKIWNDGDYTCLGVERQRPGLVVIVR